MNTKPGTIGRKLGCTQIFEENGAVTRVTVIEAGPVVVVGKRTLEKDGYTALVLGLDERKEKHTTKPVAGLFKKAGMTPKRFVQELRCEPDFAAKWEVGQPLKLDEIFNLARRSTHVGPHADADSLASCVDGALQGPSAPTEPTNTAVTLVRSART